MQPHYTTHPLDSLQRTVSLACVKTQHLTSGSRNALQRIQQLGFDATWFDGAITSGEVTHVQLADRHTSKLQQLGRKCLHFTWKSRGTVSLEGLDLQVSTRAHHEVMLCRLTARQLLCHCDFGCSGCAESGRCRLHTCSWYRGYRPTKWCCTSSCKHARNQCTPAVLC